MSCGESCCPEVCPTSDTLGGDCVDEHLSSLCPPPCGQCCRQRCFSSFNCCPINCCSSSCKPNECEKRYQMLKHMIKCPPCGRTNFKPVVSCKIFNPCEALCFVTTYTKTYNTKCCCLPTLMGNCCEMSCETQ